jgi:molybdopterin converting factor small subunit
MSDPITVRLQLFARLREVCEGCQEVVVEVSVGGTVQDCFDTLCGQFPDAGPFRGTLAAARNEEYASWDDEVAAGDVVAFIPPVSGG